MSGPPTIPDSDSTDQNWRRKVARLVNAIASRTMSQGPTGERPPNPVVGTMFYDTTLMRPIWYGPDGSWRNAVGGVV